MLPGIFNLVRCIFKKGKEGGKVCFFFSTFSVMTGKKTLRVDPSPRLHLAVTTSTALVNADEHLPH